MTALTPAGSSRTSTGRRQQYGAPAWLQHIRTRWPAVLPLADAIVASRGRLNYAHTAHRTGLPPEVLADQLDQMTCAGLVVHLDDGTLRRDIRHHTLATPENTDHEHRQPPA